MILESEEEKAIRKSWGRAWNVMRKSEKAHGCFYVILGEWSGYKANQRRIVHVDIGSSDIFSGIVSNSSSPRSKLSDYEKSVTTRYLGRIVYSDNTTLEVTICQITFEDLFNDKLYRKVTYDRLIESLIKSGKKTYMA